MDRRQEQREILMIQIEENKCNLADGLDHAIIGVTAGTNMKVVYSSALILHQYITEGMEAEEALDNFYFNIIGGNQNGYNDPVFLLDF
tara:strand:+ start:438 stop:701 length:264 start_codon:yes stop_codon:yes gene_type:complete